MTTSTSNSQRPDQPPAEAPPPGTRWERMTRLTTFGTETRWVPLPIHRNEGIR